MNKFVKLLSLTTLTLALMTTGMFAATPTKVAPVVKSTTAVTTVNKDAQMNINGSSELIANKITETNNLLNSLKVNGTIQTNLYENPTTGYVWQFQITGDKNVISYTFEAPVTKTTDSKGTVSTPAICGAGSDKTLTIKGLKPGRATLKMQLVRPWEKNTAPIKTMEFEILVK